jgi:hypothetical protein
MPKEYTFPPKLEIIIAHLKAVRALDDYVRGIEMRKDIEDLSNHVRQELDRSVLRPAGWRDLEVSKGVLYSFPMSPAPDNALLTKWWVAEGSAIRVAVEVTGPVHAVCDPYVELWVPDAWDKREAFIKDIKQFKPPDFEHVSDYPVGELTTTSSIFKYVPYETCIGPDGLFDGARFIGSFRDATAALVKLENDIDGILAGLD